MNNTKLQSLQLGDAQTLTRKDLKKISGGATYCYNEIRYDDGYTYTASQGSDIEGCRSLVGTSYEDTFGTFTVKNCFCTSYA